MRTLVQGDVGNDVKIVQSLLTKVGYNPGVVDGIFGLNTKKSVIEFQNDNFLIGDGIVGDNTWRKLDRFLYGYDIYYIQPGDTMYNIAKQYYTSVNSIIRANPDVNPNNLMIGQKIFVPYGIDVVLTDVGYTYEIMQKNIEGLKVRYPFIEVGSIGNSVLGRTLYYIKLGKGNRKVFYNATHHSLEWINTPVLMKFTEKFLKAYVEGRDLRGYDVRKIWDDSTIYIVPMVNPDGVDIVINGIDSSNPYYTDILKWNKTGKPLSEVWNANTRGVDLNRNYPASWDEAKAQESMLGVTGPGPTRYGGPVPLSEPETKAIVDFTNKHNFRMVIAYHTQGEVIYWKYLDITPLNALSIAQTFARASGYVVSDTPYEAAYAGYKDWFIKQYRKPGYTIETGIGKNPLPINQFDSIYNDNEEILLLAPII